eukprot:c26473_g1_i1 orf=520-1824(+)
MGDDAPVSQGNQKLVVLGIPWDVDTDGLRQYMSKYGAIDDIIVMKERGTGRSRGFGYVTFSSSESAEKALATKHVLNGRLLEVKVATPKEDMKRPTKKITRIFVAKIASHVNEEMFRSYFEKFGTIIDIYMPKEQGSKSHRGIGFITYENSESVDKVMGETHEIGGSAVAVDKATPKEEPSRNWEKGSVGAYGAYSPYIAAATAARFGPFGMPGFGAYDYTRSGPPGGYGPAGLGGRFGGNSFAAGASHKGPLGGGSGITHPAGFGAAGQSVSMGKSLGNKIFVGRLPSETTSDDLRRYFSNFGRILDVYLPKDSNKSGHRGFAFVTFSDDGPAERVARRSHDLLGREIVVERATPQDESGAESKFPGTGSGMPAPVTGGLSREFGSLYPQGSYLGGPDYSNGWGPYSRSDVGAMVGSDIGGRSSRMAQRYRPY